MDMNAETNNSDPDSAGDEAIEWFVRLRAGALSVEEQAAFETWLAHGQENAVAFEDVLQMYGHLAGMRPFRKVKRRVYPKRQIFAAGVAAFAAASLAILRLVRRNLRVFTLRLLRGRRGEKICDAGGRLTRSTQFEILDQGSIRLGRKAS